MRASVIVSLSALLLVLPHESLATETAAQTMGYGVASCAQFAQDYQVSTAVEENYFNWAQGYMSGLNEMFGVAGAPTYDLSTLTVDDTKASIRNYCASNPLKAYKDAVTVVYFSFTQIPAPKPNHH